MDLSFVQKPFNKWQLLILGVALLIFSLGLIMIFSATSAEILDHGLDKSTHQSFIRQMLYAVCGGYLCFLAWRMGYEKILKWSPYFLLGLTVLLILVLIPGIGREVNGSKRWLNLFGFSFQPSEFVKYIIPAYFIHRFLPFQDKEVTLKDFLKVVSHVAFPMGLILIEPNNGTTAVIAVTLLALFLMMQVPVRFWAMPLGIFSLIIVVFASQLPYVTARLNVYLHPELDLKGKGHQPYQAKIAAGSGQFLGRGPGNSLQKMSYLPEAQNDYIAAIFAEEWGFIGILSLISLYLTLAIGGFTIALQAPNKEGFYLAGSITFLISLQAFLNLGVVSGLLPSTGLNLPLFSQGGSSLMANMTGLAILLTVAKKRGLSK